MQYDNIIDFAIKIPQKNWSRCVRKLYVWFTQTDRIPHSLWHRWGSWQRSCKKLEVLLGELGESWGGQRMLTLALIIQQMYMTYVYIHIIIIIYFYAVIYTILFTMHFTMHIFISKSYFKSIVETYIFPTVLLGRRWQQFFDFRVWQISRWEIRLSGEQALLEVQEKIKLCLWTKKWQEEGSLVDFDLNSCNPDMFRRQDSAKKSTEVSSFISVSMVFYGILMFFLWFTLLNLACQWLQWLFFVCGWDPLQYRAENTALCQNASCILVQDSEAAAEEEKEASSDSQIMWRF